MQTSYHYLAADVNDTDWGMQVITGGYSQFTPGQVYPNQGHPSDHAFSWNKGRVLNGYYLVYITRGQGLFEADNIQASVVTAGTVFLLYPGVWHRYKPDDEVGWEEYWIGFKGNYPDHLMHKTGFSPTSPCLLVGCHTQLIALFQHLLDTIRVRPLGYPPILAGIAMQLLGVIHSLLIQQPNENSRTKQIIEQAIFLIRERAGRSVDMEAVARELGVGYAWFRKAFKHQTRQSPLQYLIRIKINRAKELLRSTNLTVSEVAYHLEFTSPLYFSRLFKQKAGMTPVKYRTNQGYNTL